MTLTWLFELEANTLLFVSKAACSEIMPVLGILGNITLEVPHKYSTAEAKMLKKTIFCVLLHRIKMMCHSIRRFL